MFQVMPNEAVFRKSGLQSQGAGLVYRWGTEFFGHGEHALNAAEGNGALALVEGATEAADVRTGLVGSP